ncbi:cryptochrome [Rhizoclosmatium globosum]|uniref:Cryptochrome DASH n=1 Tax=Rhizoclosmatium globosum TaxID=329046 RepID=A0A1Y2CWT7_9FUNG|nr:cryptochrome [Rhizoclosmatium globosum]|eukprot:ORY50805.1 cryptochrome [Rhizoclosmatium globosum]
MTSCVLFRLTDLRLHDNVTLARAIADATTNNKTLLPMFVWDTRFLGLAPTQQHQSLPSRIGTTWHFGFPRLSAQRQRFLLESLVDLKSQLQKLKSDLVVIVPPHNVALSDYISAQIVPSLQNGSDGGVSVFMGADSPCYEERILERELSECTGFSLKLVKDNHTMLSMSAVEGRVPDIYTQFRSNIERSASAKSDISFPAVALPLPSPTKLPSSPVNVVMEHTLSLEDLESLLKSCPANKSQPSVSFPFKGGETAALARLKAYMSGPIAKYKETRNGLLGSDYSTKFSPYLAWGCLSARTIIHAMRPLTAKAQDGTYWAWFELLWRDYFYFVARDYGNMLFYPTGLTDTPVKAGYTHAPTNPKFVAWCEGRTGVPFVDANMRELKATGFMSNRGRQNVASFLVKDLGVDWRLGAEWFEAMLLDHDPCSNYGNWLYVAGWGNDPRQATEGDGRYFNVLKQARDYDPKAEYVLAWCPELHGHPNPHAPWTRTGVFGSDNLYARRPICMGKGWDRHLEVRAESGKKEGNGRHRVPKKF